MFADVLAAGLRAVPGVRVAGHRPACDPQLAGFLGGARPDVVTVEVEQLAGRLATHVGDWRRVVPNARFAALTGSSDTELAAEAAHAGLDVWIPKESSTERLVSLVRLAWHGHAWYPPSLLAAVFTRWRSADLRRVQPFDSLSERENEVLRAVVSGAGAPEIAVRLRLSRHTVRTHMRNIFKKLDVHSGLELVKLARAAGIEPGAPAEFTPPPRKE
ncbi:response regulator transcription factor [Amycolatopsis acidicola]|uniref:Response regulator transcription factor n=1 Tax=Amycolatopsis acidicola TaxID=2596893 RepID=A0A5N0V6U3_9PSEU|nr:response regulator transcription factor [Amycolatopsis acidicola]